MQAYPKLQLSLQWIYPAHRHLLTRHHVRKTIGRSMQAFLALETLPLPIAPAQIAVRVVDKEEGQALNQQFRAKDYATNVLTFAYTTSPALCADLVLCAPVLEREAHEQAKDLRAHYTHMLVHGTLHAMGMDHELGAAHAARMEALETRIMAALDFPNPYEA